jgi:hypothetical protein
MQGNQIQVVALKHRETDRHLNLALEGQTLSLNPSQ